MFRFFFFLSFCLYCSRVHLMACFMYSFICYEFYELISFAIIVLGRWMIAVFWSAYEKKKKMVTIENGEQKMMTVRVKIVNRQTNRGRKKNPNKNRWWRKSEMRYRKTKNSICESNCTHRLFRLFDLSFPIHSHENR